jgi:hypothetical protein
MAPPGELETSLESTHSNHENRALIQIQPDLKRFK